MRAAGQLDLTHVQHRFRFNVFTQMHFQKFIIVLKKNTSHLLSIKKTGSVLIREEKNR